MRRGDLRQACKVYENARDGGALAETDFSRSKALAICYLYGKPQQLSKAVEWLDKLLSLRRSDEEVSFLLAQALRWSGQYKAALEHYAALRNFHPDNPDYTAGLAFTWEALGKSQQALQLLRDFIERYPPNASVLIGNAQILAHLGKYQEAQETLNRALALEPENQEARLRKAQTFYWSGRLAESEAMLRELRREAPDNVEAAVMLASLEHGLGRNRRALALLEQNVVADDGEADQLRARIVHELRPVLRLGFGLEDALDIPRPDRQLSTRSLRYSSVLEFGVNPDVRMSVSNAVTMGATSNPVLARGGSDSFSTETMARISFQAAPWLQLMLGAGDGTSGDSNLGLSSVRHHHFLYDVHPIIRQRDLRIDFSATRGLVNYTPLAVHENAVESRQEGAASLYWRRRLRLTAGYWHAQYSLLSEDGPVRRFGASANGASALVAPTLVRREKFRLEAGTMYQVFGFDGGAAQIADPINGLGSAGFFTPRLFHRIEGTGHLFWQMHPRMKLEIDGGVGAQRISGFTSLSPPLPQFGSEGHFTTRLELKLGYFDPYVEYRFFTTATPASPGLTQGEYRAHSMNVGLERRF